MNHAPHYTQTPPSEPLETIGANGRIGLVALATDLTSESDLRRMAPSGVEIFTNRILNRNPITRENLLAMTPDIPRTAGGILPGAAVDVLLYSCTSGTAVIGEDEIARLLREGKGDATLPCTTPVGAAKAALRAFAAQKISVLTPYTEAVNREIAAMFTEAGVAVINIHGFGIESDVDMAAVTHNSIRQGALDACAADADVLFISCTALRAAEMVGALEAELGKPVITSNQAMLWHALVLLKREFKVRNFGELFARRLE